ENKFFARVTDQQITVDTGPDGRATGLILHKAGRPMPGVRFSSLAPPFGVTGEEDAGPAVAAAPASVRRALLRRQLDARRHSLQRNDERAALDRIGLRCTIGPHAGGFPRLPDPPSRRRRVRV